MASSIMVHATLHAWFDVTGPALHREVGVNDNFTCTWDHILLPRVSPAALGHPLGTAEAEAAWDGPPTLSFSPLHLVSGQRHFVD